MDECIQSLWVGSALSKLERACASSWIYHGHQFELFVYDDVGQVPEGVILRDANTVIPERDVFLCKNSYAMFADLFRWQLLYERGGYWVDMDMLCLKRLDFKDRIVFGLENNQLANIGLLRFPPQHAVTREMLLLAKNPNRLIGNERAKLKIKKWIRRHLLFGSTWTQRWGEAAGPKAFTLVLKKHDLFKLGKPFTCFYPVGPENWHCLFDTTLEQDCAFYQSTYAVHLWNDLLRRNGFVKDADFPPESFIEHQKKTLGVE